MSDKELGRVQDRIKRERNNFAEFLQGVLERPMLTKPKILSSVGDSRYTPKFPYRYVSNNEEKVTFGIILLYLCKAIT